MPAQAARPSLASRLGVAIAMIAFGAIVIVGSLQVGIGWGAEGPKSGFFPFYLGLAIIAGERRQSRHGVRAGSATSSSPTGRSFVQVLSVVIPTAIYVCVDPVDRHLRRRRWC